MRSRLRRAAASAVPGVRLQADLRIVEIPPVFVGHTRQELKKRIEAAIERAAELRDRAVDRVQRQSGFAVLQPQAGFVSADERAFGNESDAVDQRVARHSLQNLSRAAPVHRDDEHEQRRPD